SLVAQERVLVKPGDSEVGLRPAAGARGVLRVTVLEFQKKLLQPIAERLIYCAPAERLELTVTADKKNYRPGERVTLTLKSGDEKGQPEQTWLLASVGKQDAVSQADGSPRPGLPIAMQFSTSLDQPEDLELAYLGMPDSPEARAVIDLFLATQGWRRIVESGARGGQGTAPSSRDRDSAAVALFALDNLGEAQKRYLQEVEEEVSKAR